jgi:hypothetical protein
MLPQDARSSRKPTEEPAVLECHHRELEIPANTWMEVCRVAQSVQCLAKGGRPGDWGSIRGGSERIFPVASVSTPALEPTHPPLQWIPWVLSPELKRGRGVTLTTHHHLLPRSRMSRSYTFSPPKRFRGL